MRDLSLLPPASFDLVWQPYSINFVPDVRVVFREVARVLRLDGTYHLQCANPFTMGLAAADWTGRGYPLELPYTDGAQLAINDPHWVYDRSRGHDILPAQEYRHTLSTLINGLVAAGFTLTHLDDSVDVPADPTAAPGSWEHFTAVAPPWLALTSIYRPALTPSSGA